MTWLAETPSAIFSAFAAMLPRLEAHETRTLVQAVAVGRSLKPGSWIRRQLDDWHRTAEGTSGVKKAPSARDLGAAGVKLKVVKRG